MAKHSSSENADACMLLWGVLGIFRVPRGPIYFGKVNTNSPWCINNSSARYVLLGSVKTFPRQSYNGVSHGQIFHSPQ